MCSYVILYLKMLRKRINIKPQQLEEVKRFCDFTISKFTEFFFETMIVELEFAWQQSQMIHCSVISCIVI